ncbi:MAG: dihydrofolate reductase family protein, partial [Myxococcales bacterium]|nr:dihydrofolate reductase family protein [Myxococcales bacterium]
LFERSRTPTFGLPEPLARTYGGDLGFERPRLFANFVASIDGVVALPAGGESGKIISQESEPDRFVMGLLRACADAVVIGAGTFRKSPGHVWDAGGIFPAGAAAYAELRRRLGRSERPPLVLVSASGDLDPAQPALADALVVTTRAGEARLRGRLPGGARLLVGEGERIGLADLVRRLHAEGLTFLLTEGGPSLLAELAQERVLDELFVTRSPTLFGRYTDDRRKSLADGLDLGGAQFTLLGVRRHGSHLFLRYAAGRPGAAQ